MYLLWGGLMFFEWAVAITMIILAVEIWTVAIMIWMNCLRIDAETKRIEQETAETNKRYRVLL
jgi:hypothetical protein